MEKGIDYNQYKLTTKEWLYFGAMSTAYLFVLGMIFYQHLLIALCIASGAWFFIREKKEEARIKRQKVLTSQFKEGIYSLSSALGAGRSTEQAFIQSLKDLRMVYREEDMIVREWQQIVDRLSMNEPIETVLNEFGERSGVEDIQNFISVFSLAQRSGGDQLRIIRETSKMLGDKMDVEKELEVLVAQKTFEQWILSLIIPGMIVFFSITAPDFLRPLYTSLTGRGLMTIAFAMYLLSRYIGRKIIRVEV